MILVNPFLPYAVSDVWRDGHHAVDYRTPLGTRFVAPGDGVYRRRPSELRNDIPDQAGHYGDLVFPDGSFIRFCHLDGHIARDGATVTRGVTVLAETGNTGTSTGPHMHTYGRRANGDRWNWTLDASALPAGGGASPFDPEGEETMPLSEDDIERIWAHTIRRGTKRIPVLQEVADAKTEAMAAHAAIDAHVADWLHGNPALTPPREPGRLYTFLRRAAEPASIDVTALAAALAGKLGATPAQVEAAVRDVLEDLTLTTTIGSSS